MDDYQRRKLADLDREMRQALEPVTKAACDWMACRLPKITFTLPDGQLNAEHEPLPADIVAARDAIVAYYRAEADKVRNPCDMST